MDGISFSNLAYVEEQYQRCLANPDAIGAIESSWKYFFEGWELALSLVPATAASSDIKIYHLIEAYRTYGHLKAPVNPLVPPPANEGDSMMLEFLI
jgi:2-oxoglutarate dehydrogenase E1 component